MRKEEAVAVPKRAMFTPVACAAAVGRPVLVAEATVDDATVEEVRVVTTMELVDAALAALEKGGRKKISQARREGRRREAHLAEEAAATEALLAAAATEAAEAALAEATAAAETELAEAWAAEETEAADALAAEALEETELEEACEAELEAA